jgi:hypothetical protein
MPVNSQIPVPIIPLLIILKKRIANQPSRQSAKANLILSFDNTSARIDSILSFDTSVRNKK